MATLSPSLQRLLNRMLVSLPAWHLVEALASAPGHALPLPTLVGLTGLDVTQARRAIAQLSRLGLVRRCGPGRVGLAPRHAADLARLVEAATADRAFMMRVIKQAARRECTAGPLQLTIRCSRLSGSRSPR